MSAARCSSVIGAAPGFGGPSRLAAGMLTVSPTMSARMAEAAPTDMPIPIGVRAHSPPVIDTLRAMRSAPASVVRIPSTIR